MGCSSTLSQEGRKSLVVVSDGAATREVVGQDRVKGGTDLIVPPFSGAVPSRKLIPEFEDKS